MILVLTLVCLLFLSGIFSSMETSLATLNKAKIKALFISSKMKIFKDWITSPSSVYSTILIGNNLVNISFSSLLSFVVIEWSHRRGLSAGASVAVALAATTSLILFFGEIMPKNIATTYPRQVSENVGWILNIFRIALLPFTETITVFSNWIIGYKSPSRDLLISRGDIGELSKTLAADDRSSKIISKILTLSQKKVSEIMTPRREIIGIDLSKSTEKIRELITDSGVSRFPAYYGSLKNLAGIIYTREIVTSAILGVHEDFRRYIHRPFFIESETSLLAAYRNMLKNRVHIAVVEEADKKLVGIVTMENLLEEIFGEILDEYDLKRFALASAAPTEERR